MVKQRAFSHLEWVGLVAGVITALVMVTGCPSTAPPAGDPPPGLPTPDPDADADGVTDADDLCADTPAGTAVDNDGCPTTIVVDPDLDGDGVLNADDNCANTGQGVNVDADGCPVSTPGTPDTDGDGVNDDVDQCEGTPAGVTVDVNGCPDSERDSDGDGVNDDIDMCPDTDANKDVDNTGCAANQLDGDRDGVTDDNDECPDSPAGARVDPTGCTVTSPPGGGGGPPPPTPAEPVCGDGTIEGAETCEPPNTATCNSTCQIIASGSFSADACADAAPIIGEGAFEFDNTAATQDGPGHRDCVNEGQDNMDGDVWACWTAPCTATAFVQTCGLATIDTKLAVYEGCDCPVADATLLSCNDDRCDLQSIATFEAQAGQQYLIRVGSFVGSELGTGAVSLTCGLDSCTATSGACTEENGSAGCSDESCCETVCAIDSFCCDTNWDSVCVEEAAGLCSGSFSACARGAGACTNGDEGNGTPGCSDIDCCNTVCAEDPFCCLNAWDNLCAEQEARFCRSTCGVDAGDCFAVGGNGSPGCESTDCCAEVCTRDPLCCSGEWDAVCAEAAVEFCTP